MKTYIISLKSTGALTQLPDSQRVFGALTYLYAETFGPEKATAFVQAVLSKNLHLALSNVLPMGYLPTPQEYLIDSLKKHGCNDVDHKTKRNAVKKRQYLKDSEIHKLLQDPTDCENLFPYVKLVERHQLRTSIESLNKKIPGLDSKLYSVPVVIPLEMNNKKDDGKVLVDFCFYLQIDDSSLSNGFFEVVNKASQINQTIILGKRASQGMNTYQFGNVQENPLQYDEKKELLNTGMLLPDQIDFAASTLKLFTSQRRPFEMTGAWNENAKKYFISFIAQGSIVCASAGVRHAGQSIRSKFNENRDIVFGNALLYPIWPREGSVG